MGELASVAYIAFTRTIRAIAAHLAAELASAGGLQKEWLSRKPLLKRIDEYNYMKYSVPAMKQKRDRAKVK